MENNNKSSGGAALSIIATICLILGAVLLLAGNCMG